MVLMSDFFAMGGYAAFIWPCYIASMGGMLVLAVMSYKKKKTLEKRLDALKKMDKKK